MPMPANGLTDHAVPGKIEAELGVGIGSEH